MIDFSDHDTALKKLKEAQEADTDNREAAREAHLFVDKRDGQWEPYWWDACSGAPRYTFDLVNPIIDQVAGKLDMMDFDINVRPAGGEASKDTALVMDGMVRNIETLSNASHVYNQSARGMITAGMDGWEVVQEFVDSDSFDQDLLVKQVNNYVDRVWLDPGAEAQDGSDANYGYVLQAVPKDEYEERWPKGSGKSVSIDRQGNAYYNKPDTVAVGKIYYIKETPRDLVLMSNGAVYEKDEKFESLVDELTESGIVIENERTRIKRTVFARLFDGSDWLNKEQETVFQWVPIIPTYANFKINESKLIYWGIVEKRMDPQRVLNYSQSREIAEGALAPRAKYFVTDKQYAGHEETFGSMNTNQDPVQVYTPDPEAPGPPQQQGGAPINPGLRSITENMTNIIGQGAGMFAANMGDNPGLQSGIAIEKLQDRGDIGTTKYVSSQEMAICHTARILVDAIPKVYDTQRQVRILGADGKDEMKVLNQQMIDKQTRQTVTLNDLSKGTYDVTCKSGPSFQSRQQETVTAITEIAAVDPTVAEISGDILFNNITAPGMDLIAERKRRQLFTAGAIPPEQWTDLEQQEAAQAQQQEQPPDPASVIAQAELTSAQAEQTKVQVDAQQQQFDQFIEQQNLILQQNKDAVDNINTMADTLKKLREGMGVDTIVGPHGTEAFIQQATTITEAQADLT